MNINYRIIPGWINLEKLLKEDEFEDLPEEFTSIVFNMIHKVYKSEITEKKAIADINEVINKLSSKE